MAAAAQRAWLAEYHVTAGWMTVEIPRMAIAESPAAGCRVSRATTQARESIAAISPAYDDRANTVGRLANPPDMLTRRHVQMRKIGTM